MRPEIPERSEIVVQLEWLRTILAEYAGDDDDTWIRVTAIDRGGIVEITSETWIDNATT